MKVFEDMIMGSETEFGLIPRTLDDYKVLREMNKILFSRKFYEYSRSDLNKLSRWLNWWFEDLSARDKVEDRSYGEEVLRRLGISGSYIQNGARVYIDGYHPEYSTPECEDPFDLVAYERAGEIVMREVVDKVEKKLGIKIDLLKRNWNPNSDVTYACHENYLVSRQLFEALVKKETPERDVWIMHLVTRQIYAGAGRFDPKRIWPDCFGLSERQSFIETMVNADTMHQRALINARNRPYADPAKWGRLHVIVGDSARADLTNILKYGVSRLILTMLDDLVGRIPHNDYLLLDDPVQAFRGIKNEWSVIKAKRGEVSALDGQRILLELVSDWFRWRERIGKEIRWGKRVLDLWEKTLDMLEKRDDLLYHTLDRFIKSKLFDDSFSDKGDMNMLASLNYNYQLVGENSLFDYLVQNNRIVTWVSPEEIEFALSSPPPTRAMLRAGIAKILEDVVVHLSWHSIELRYSEYRTGFVSMPDPRSKSEFYYDNIPADIHKTDM